MTEEPLQQNTQTLLLLIGKIDGKQDMMIATLSNLATQVDAIERGRLTKNEIDISTNKNELSVLKTNLHIKARNIALIYGGFISLIVVVVGAWIIHLLKL